MHALESLASRYNVSRETLLKLETHFLLLKQWQKRINLVSASTLENAVQRHYEDSLQLLPYIQEGDVLLDVGCGAGFPGFVLACTLRPKKVTLLDSDRKKCSFLVAAATKAEITPNIVCERAENHNGEYSLIVSRAMASVENLLESVSHLLLPETRLLLLKGKTLSQELEQAHKKWNFQERLVPSATSDQGWIVELQKLTPKRIGEKE
jgi:16S rRNA (guanine527-N7)-methyltransferase